MVNKMLGESVIRSKRVRVSSKDNKFVYVLASNKAILAVTSGGSAFVSAMMNQEDARSESARVSPAR